jgi:cryptochrome
LSWEQGLKTFLYYQIDVFFSIKIIFIKSSNLIIAIFVKADWSVCSGNWNWISSGDPAEALNPTIAFCPINHGKSMDPTGAYIR